MSWLWFSVFLAWLVKVFVLKLAGQHYNRSRMFFLGMIFGSLLRVAPLSGAYSAVLLITIFAGAWFVWHYNETHTDSFMLMPLLDHIPSLRGDIPAQAEWSWRVVALVGVLVLILNVVTHARSASRKGDDEGDQ